MTSSHSRVARDRGLYVSLRRPMGRVEVAVYQLALAVYLILFWAVVCWLGWWAAGPWGMR